MNTIISILIIEFCIANIIAIYYASVHKKECLWMREFLNTLDIYYHEMRETRRICENVKIALKNNEIKNQYDDIKN